MKTLLRRLRFTCLMMTLMVTSLNKEDDCQTADCEASNQGKVLIEQKISIIIDHYKRVTGVDLEQVRAQGTIITMKYFFILILSIIVLQACTEDEPELASYEERVTQAIENLEDELTSPVNGWVLNYRPTNSSGVYFMLLNFSEDGSVRVQTDLSANEGDVL